MKIEKGQIWISKTEPFRSIEIYDILESYDKSDKGMHCFWKIYDDKAWEDFIIKKKFKGEGTLEEHFRNMENTFPYPYAGECSFCSMKQRIRKYKLELLNNK